MRRRALVAAVSTIAAALLATTAIEVWVRLTWDVRRGTPDFYVPDPVLGQRLRANYSGWFAGVPVHIDSLGLRDPREYDLAKRPNTFRILVLGDSVTFGHGSVYEHTYPYLLEQRLKRWHRDVDWQVWNAAVPGYNTSQELAQLLELGPRFRPDLVIVGFYDNDLMGDTPIAQPSVARRLLVAAEAFARRHFWSIEFYRRIYWTIRWRTSVTDEEYHRRVEMLARSDSFAPQDVSGMPEQQITDYDWLSDEEMAHVKCVGPRCEDSAYAAEMRRDPDYQPWIDAVMELQRLNRSGQYRIVFFLNVVPRPSYGDDRFYADQTSPFNRFALRILSDGTPAVSCHDTFLHVRPTQMPNASGHSIGNSNALKADVLFEYLKANVLPK